MSPTKALRRSHHAARLAVVTALAAALALPFGAVPARASAISYIPDPGVWGFDGRVRTIVRLNGVVYVGGDFLNAVSPDGTTFEPRSHLAAIDSTGALLPWAPGANRDVYDLDTDGTQIFVSGDFTSITTTDGTTTVSTPRARFAALAPFSYAPPEDLYGRLLSLKASANHRIRALCLEGSVLYLGGGFNKLDGQPRANLAAVDLSTNPPGALLPWAPSAAGGVTSLAVLDPSDPASNVVVGGDFSSILGTSGSSGPFLAEIGADGSIAAWATTPDDKVLAVFSVGGNVYVGEGGHGNAAVAYDSTGDQLWLRETNGDVQAIGFADGMVIAGGHFGRIGTTDIRKLVAIDAVSGLVDPNWLPRPKPTSNHGVWAIWGTADKLYVGGDFTRMRMAPASRFAQFSIS